MSITFIRHGEKPKSGIHLNKDGYLRSKFLPTILEKIPKPDIIIAMSQHNKHTSNRPYETVKDLAEYLNLEIISDFTRYQVSKLINFIEKHPDKNILICWEHNVLSEIMYRITNVDVKWHSYDYDSIYVWFLKDTLERSSGKFVHINQGFS